MTFNSMKKREHSLSILKRFFVQHSSEYETSDSDRKVNRNIFSKEFSLRRFRAIVKFCSTSRLFTNDVLLLDPHLKL